jgi:hypothetical protein
VLLLHTTQAQLLKSLKDNAAGAVQSATGVPMGSRPASTGDATGSGRPALTLGKPAITFTSTPTPGAGTPTATRFAPTDNIYARVPLKGTLQELLTQQDIGPSEDGKTYLPISIRPTDAHGSGYESLSMLVTPQDLTKRELILDILPAKGTAKTPYRLGSTNSRPIGSVFLNVGGNFVDFGSHTFQLTVANSDELSGTFEMNIPDKATAAAIAQRVEGDYQALSRQLAFATVLPLIFSKP